MLSEKVRGVLNTRAEAVTGCDNSCLMHIGGALHRQRTGVRPVHLAEILASEEGGRPMSDTLARPDAPRPSSRWPRKALMGDSQLRKNVRHATNVIQTKRANVVAEMPDWQELREAGKQIRQHTMRASRLLPRAVRAQLHRGRRARPLGERCGRRAADRRRTGEGKRRERHVADRSHQDQVDDHRGDSAQQGAGSGWHPRLRDRSCRADHSAWATTSRRTSSCPRCIRTARRSARSSGAR